LIIPTTVTLASSNNALPDDGVTDSTETCRSCFNVNFNIPFKATLLCISWLIKNCDDIIIIIYCIILQTLLHVSALLHNLQGALKLRLLKLQNMKIIKITQSSRSFYGETCAVDRMWLWLRGELRGL
jgi:hypothetical protein